MSFFSQVSAMPNVNCQRCFTANDLYVVTPVIPESDFGGFLCTNCLAELAVFAGYVKHETHTEAIEELNETIATLTSQIQEIPNLIERVVDGANNLLADFILSVASVTSVDKPVQPESNKANIGNTETQLRDAEAERYKHKQDNKPSPKSAK